MRCNCWGAEASYFRTWYTSNWATETNNLWTRAFWPQFVLVHGGLFRERTAFFGPRMQRFSYVSQPPQGLLVEHVHLGILRGGAYLKVET
jgi:hypothetical protein